MKTISYFEAMAMLEHPLRRELRIRPWGRVKAVQIDEPFTLIAVPGGSNGSQGGPGDWIALHPEGYPTIVSDHVAWEHAHVG